MPDFGLFIRIQNRRRKRLGSSVVVVADVLRPGSPGRHTGPGKMKNWSSGVQQVGRQSTSQVALREKRLKMKMETTASLYCVSPSELKEEMCFMCLFLC